MRINTKVVIDLKTDKVIARQSFDHSGPVALAVAGTAITKVGEIAGRGGMLQFYTASINPGSIAAGAEEIETFAVTGVRAGDPVFVSAEDPDVNTLVTGAKVTANDVVSVWVNNNITVTTALDAGAFTINLMILKAHRRRITKGRGEIPAF